MASRAGRDKARDEYSWRGLLGRVEWSDPIDAGRPAREPAFAVILQVCFTVTGPKRKIDEFADGLRGEQRATIRTERAVMASPL